MVKGSNMEKNDLNRPKKARRIDNKSKFCFKLPRIDMEMSEVGKNCEKSWQGEVHSRSTILLLGHWG